jgi:hypothetical protein
MTQAEKKAEALARLDEYLGNAGKESNHEIRDLATELEILSEAEVGELDDGADIILARWKNNEQAARRNLDFAFFENVARAIRFLKFLETEVGSNSPHPHFAIATAIQAEKIISTQKLMPSWEYIHLRTELILAGRYAYINSGGGADAVRFKALALQEWNLLRGRSKNRELKWNVIRKEIGLQGLLRDRLTSRERKAIEALKKKILP